jgi:hypothetical protein
MLRPDMRHRQDFHLPFGLACLASLLALAWFGPAAALAGPGVDLLVGAKTITVSGDQITGEADVQGTSYTLKAPGVHSKQIQLTGLSINSLLSLAGLDTSTIESVAVEHPDGGETDLNQADISASPPYPEGPAVVFENGSTTGFFRPIVGPGDNNASDATTSSPDEPLQITVQTIGQLTVSAKATPKRTSVGQSVTFVATASGGSSGAVSYDWSFGDGSTGSGSVVSHSYQAIGQYAAAVTATVPGSGAVSAVLAVVVGHPKTSKVPGAGTSNSGVGGSGTGKGGGGTGSGSSAKPAAHSAPKTTAKVSSAPGVANPLAAQAPSPPVGDQVEGILLTDAGAPLAPLVSATSTPGSAASSASQTASTGGGSVGAVGGGLALTIAIVTLGALDERRRVSLRIA